MNILQKTLLFPLFVMLSASPAMAQSKNGFDIGDALVPASRILSGGPGRDGIPSIDRPRFVKAERANFLRDDDRVLGLEMGGEAKAYPIAILNWHEIVNDRIDGRPVVITFCPLCGTGMGFDAEVAGKTRQFGVSGLLYNSDVLLYDRQSESLWSQVKMQAISGPLKGKKLTLLPLAHTTWGDWRARHPEGMVLSTKTGYSRNYRRDPYAGYEKRRDIMFPTGTLDRRYHPKERVMGLIIGDTVRAYPFQELDRAVGKSAENSFTETVGGAKISVYFDANSQSARVVNEQGKEIPTVIAFWFAWTSFHPQTEVFTGR